MRTLSTLPGTRSAASIVATAARCALMVSALFAVQTAGAFAADKAVRSFSAGDGDASVGISASETGADKEEEGPQALAVGSDGTLFLLDQVNRRILTFDPKNGAAPTRSLALPPDVQASDIQVKGSDIYVWDGRVHAFQVSGPANAPTRGLSETRSADPIDEATTTAFAQMGSREADDDDPGTTTRSVHRNIRNDLARQLVDTHGQGKVVATVKLTDAGAGATIDVKAEDGSGPATTLHMRVRDRLGTVAFLDVDQNGRMYVLAENIPLTVEDQAFAFVARYAPNGALEGIFEVPLSSTTVSRRCITVSPTGDLYFLKTLKNSVDIVGLGFREMANARVIQLPRRPNASLFSWADPKSIGVALGPLTRQKIINSALAYEGLTWTVTPPSYGHDDELCTGFNGRSRVPAYMLGKEGQSVKGVPYCWGCQGSVKGFMDRVQKGTLAGNVCTKSDPRMDAAGVDCSSFVSATWGLSTHFSTSVIPAISSRLSNPWDLQPGDALDKPGSHVVLFMGFTPNREAMVMEASPNACKGRVCRNIYPLSWLLSRGFVPVRYRGLADAGPVGAGKQAVLPN